MALASRPCVGTAEARVTKRLFALLGAVAYLGLRALCLAIVRLLSLRDRPRDVPVLTYHSLATDEVLRFERQMLDLRRRAKAVFVDDCPGTSECRAVAITFDDAFQSVFDRALPILSRHGIPV